jgi:hypothetical protein
VVVARDDRHAHACGQVSSTGFFGAAHEGGW